MAHFNFYYPCEENGNIEWKQWPKEEDQRVAEQLMSLREVCDEHRQSKQLHKDKEIGSQNKEDVCKKKRKLDGNLKNNNKPIGKKRKLIAGKTTKPKVKKEKVCKKVKARPVKIQDNDNSNRPLADRRACKICGNIFWVEEFSRHFEKCSRRFTCDFCNKELSSRGSLTDHIKLHLIKNDPTLKHKRDFTCSECDRTFRTFDDVKHHIKRAHVCEKPSICKYCGAQYPTYYKMRSHIDSVHRPKRSKKMKVERGERKTIDQETSGDFHCQKCPKSFETSRDLTRHWRGHFPSQDSCPCPFCPTEGVLHKKRNIQQHVMNHHGGQPSKRKRPFFRNMTNIPKDSDPRPERNLKCDICGAAFALLYNLQLHISGAHHGKKIVKKTNLGELRLDCPYECAASFTCKNLLKAHAKEEHNGTPFECKFCFRFLPSADHLETHRNRKEEHNRSLINRCTICSANFRSNPGLCKHLLVHGIEMRPYQCSLCPNTYITALERYFHERIHKKMAIRCPLCPTPYFSSSKEGHEYHMSRHEDVRTCDVCGFSSYRRTIFYDHMKRHFPIAKKKPEVKKHNCFCGVWFKCERAYNRHMLRHTESKFECEICREKFDKKSVLNAHRKTHDGEIFVCGVCRAGLRTVNSLKSHMLKHFVEYCTHCKKRHMMPDGTCDKYEEGGKL